MKIIKNIILAFVLLLGYNAQCQTGIGVPDPDVSAILELSSNQKGLLISRLTTSQRDAIATPAVGLMIFNLTKNCLEWYIGTGWYNVCGDNGNAIIDTYICDTDQTGIMVAGERVVGVTQTITVNVSTPGSYAISATANGVTFSDNGNFTKTGTYTVILKAVGVPAQAGTHNFTLDTDSSTCTFRRDTNTAIGEVSSYVCGTNGTGIMNLGVPVSGVTHTITATVTKIGAYSISAVANGVTFEASGSYVATGAQSIVLVARGTPQAAGSHNFVISGTPSCSFLRNTAVSVGEASSYVCSTTGNGVMNLGVPVSGVTHTVNVTVTKIGTYSISAVANGVTFEASGIYPALGAQNIILVARGTPQAVGSHNFIISGTPSCSFLRNTTVGIGEVSRYVCGTTGTGVMNVGVPVTGVTHTITATVTKIGTYSISAFANGIIFSSLGTFLTTGPQSVVLTAIGTPQVGGTHAFILQGTPSCSFNRETISTTVVGGGGATWMAYNVGATAPATSMTDNLQYGDYYQWGRGTDGHEKLNSGRTTARSSQDNPGHANFVINTDNWRSPTNANLWQGIYGTNNPCPAGFRLPTIAEWTREVSMGGITNNVTAYTSVLKFPAAGFRERDGNYSQVNVRGYYWSSTINAADDSRFYTFEPARAAVSNAHRIVGMSIRCIRN